MRYIPTSDAERQQMLQAIGVDTVDALFEPVPGHLRRYDALQVPGPLAEPDLLRIAGDHASRNVAARRPISFLGGGSYDHYVPVFVRSVMLRSEFATAYTPYQPEVSQGTLQVIYEFQTMIAQLTGLDVANASMYDGASATVEAAALAIASTGRQHVVVSAALHPHYRGVLRALLEPTGARIVELPAADGRVAPLSAADVVDAACVILPQPAFEGSVEDLRAHAAAAKAAGALVVAVVDPVSLALLTPPGEWGADIAVGEAMALASRPTYGGPAVGFFAATMAHIRRLPGRIVGRTLDNAGRRAFTLTLQTREQHIRREKATSNICTNQGLFALAATVHLAALGPQGLREVAERCLRLARYAADRIAALPGYTLMTAAPFFREFVVGTPIAAAELALAAAADGVLIGIPMSRFDASRTHELLVACTDRNTRADIDRLIDVLGRVGTRQAMAHSMEMRR